MHELRRLRVYDRFNMAFLKKLFQGSSRNKKKEYPHITSGTDPLEKWRKIGELGDGAFGTVFKVFTESDVMHVDDSSLSNFWNILD